MTERLEEIWKDIQGYEGLYKISEHGEVKGMERRIKAPQGTRVIKEKTLKPYMSNNYKKVYLCKDGKCKQYSIHRLVATNFIRPARDKEVVNHIDGNKMNNHYSNLEWCTQADNNKHAMKTGLWKNYGVNNHLSKFDGDDLKEIRFLLKKGYTHKEIALRYNVHEATIGKIHRGETYKQIGVVNK